jgi:hypothetical protein
MNQSNNTIPPYAINFMPKVYTEEIHHPLSIVFESMYIPGPSENDALAVVTQLEINRFHVDVPKITGEHWSRVIKKIVVDAAEHISPELQGKWDVVKVVPSFRVGSAPIWNLELKRTVQTAEIK